MSAPFIKLCGMTTAAAVSAALACEVDAVGFVFAPSVRQLDCANANLLAAPARGKIACVAVTRHPTRAQVAEILRDFNPDVLQTDIEDLDALDLPASLTVLPVMRPGRELSGVLADRVLFEGPTSGSGLTTDWITASDLARRTQLILAGGLNTQNVGDAIRLVQPFGVDVSSGIEDRPGNKNTEMIEQFVAAARLAAMELNS